MSRKANRIVNLGERSSSLSPLRTQGTESHLEATQGEDLSSALDLFVSVTHSESTGNGFTLKVNSFRRKNTCSDVEEMELEDSILGVVLSELLKEECSELKELAEAWINTYESSQFEALRSMLELILHSTGVLQPLTKEQALKLEQLTADTYDTWMSEPQVKPLMLEDLFFKNLLNFLKLTLVGCLDDILIMKRIQNLLDVFSKSTWVSSRYAALMIGSFITVQYTKFCSQLHTELHDVLVTGNETILREKMADAKDFFEKFIEIVILFLRDVILTVRKLACQIYCSWCVKEERLLMKDNYLRHVFWAIYDDSSSIRSLAITTCSSLYKSEYVVTNLDAFVKNSLPAIVMRARDENNRVAAVALETISEINRRVPWLLKDVDLDEIFILVYGKDWKAAKASEFIHEVFEDRSSTNMQFIFNTVMFTEESLEELGQDIDPESALRVLVDNLFPYCHVELTDWTAWRKLMLGNSLDQSEPLQQVACHLLLEVINHVSICADDRYFVETDFPPAPPLDDDKSSKNDSSGIENEKLKTECLNHLVQMTSNLGPHLLPLWERYKENKKCLTKLVRIPQYFNGTIDSLDIKKICCYLTHLRNIVCSSLSLDAVHRSLACVYHLALASHKWKHVIPKFERVLFKAVTEKFLNACARLDKRPLPHQDEMNNLKIVKQAFYLSKFFDVTKTCLLNDTIYALRFGTSTRNAEIVCPTMMMCLYFLEWQLKSLIEEALTGGETATLQLKLQSQSRTLVTQLECLITTQNSLIRETAYSVLCRLFSTFSPFNAYTARYPLTHLPPLSLETAEWLNYGLACQVSKDNIPEDENEFKMSCVALKMFCSLVQDQVLSLSYMSSILPYFQFYHHPKNYNSILESAFQTLARMEDFPHMLIELLMWMKLNTIDNVEEITAGICAVALPKLPSTKFVQRTAHEIVGCGLSQIKSKRVYFIFQILAHFVKFLEKKVAEEFYSTVMDTFHLYTEMEDVKVFLAAFRGAIQTIQGVQQSAKESA